MTTKENCQELHTNFDQMNYMKTWFELVAKMENEGFTWSSLLENDEWNQYMSPSLYTLAKKRWESLNKATEEVTNLFQKMWHIIVNDNELFLKLRLPNETWDAVLVNPDNSLFSYFCRYDFIVNENSIKLIEANVDTPTGLVEPSVANRLICDAHNVIHPNQIEKNLKEAWEQILEDYHINPTDKIFYSSYEDHDEDRETVHFNLKHCDHPLKEYIGIEDIVVTEDGLYSSNGEKIEFLYRLYPLEYLVEDIDEKGRLIGQMFLDHIATGRVKVINPPSAMIIQTKTILAVIWELFETNSDYLSEKDREVIEQYFLPTYFTSAQFEKSNTPYVSKPLWGREGGGVSIVESNEVEEDTTSYYYNQPKIYQKYMEMPDQKIGTWDGSYTGKLLFGSHVIGGKPSGLFLRVGEKITGNLSMFMGLTVE